MRNVHEIFWRNDNFCDNFDPPTSILPFSLKDSCVDLVKCTSIHPMTVTPIQSVDASGRMRMTNRLSSRDASSAYWPVVQLHIVRSSDLNVLPITNLVNLMGRELRITLLKVNTGSVSLPVIRNYKSRNADAVDNANLFRPSIDWEIWMVSDF